VTVVFDLPGQRPVGLRRPRAVEVTLTRVDTNDPDTWSWDGFAQPYHRFDPLSGSFRVRYAGWTPRTALRERFPERRIPDGDAELRLVTLRGPVRMLDLTSERVLDALGLDDRISTGRLPRIRIPGQPDPFLDACGQLTDLVADWWDDVHAIRFRSRTTPTQTNVAFCQHADLEPDAVPLADATDVLVRAVLGDGFSVPGAWLA
jgi:hypothetical protein